MLINSHRSKTRRLQEELQVSSGIPYFLIWVGEPHAIPEITFQTPVAKFRSWEGSFSGLQKEKFYPE